MLGYLSEMIFIPAAHDERMDERSANLDWFLEGDPVLASVVRRDVLGERSSSDRIADDPRIRSIIEEVTTWPWPAISNHKSAGHPLHKFAFLADLRVDLETIAGDRLLKDLESTMVNGLPRLPNRTPSHFGGSGETELAWSLCDTPLMLYSMSRCFPSFDGREGMRTISSMSRDNGMPCIVSPELGRFRGPGRKDDPCPLASLYVLKAITQLDLKGGDDLAKRIANSLLLLWENSRQRHPYMFYMGTDFRKLKLPFVWYDILSVAETLSYYSWVHRDERFKEMLSVIDDKKGADGRFTPESIWTSWKGWDFDQKKVPSRWLTFCVERLQRRVERY